MQEDEVLISTSPSDPKRKHMLKCTLKDSECESLPPNPSLANVRNCDLRILSVCGGYSQDLNPKKLAVS